MPRKEHPRKAKRHRPHAAEPSSDFLAALEAQRSKEAQSAAAPAPVATAQPKVIPGFYYDAATNKYFPGNPPPSSSPPAPYEDPIVKHKVVSSIQHLCRRELHGRHGQGHADLLHLLQRVPRTTEVGLPFHVPLTCMAMSTQGNTVAAAVRASGLVFTLHPRQHYDPHRHRSAFDIAMRSCPFFRNVGCMRFQPTKAGFISLTGLGDADTPGYFRLLNPSTLSLVYNLKAIDAWHHVWHPEGRHIAVGATLQQQHGAHPSRAHVVDVAHESVQHAPTTWSSDVFAQSYPEATSVLNGTRSGDLWLWDLRANTTALAHSIVSTPASVRALQVLSDKATVVAATSCGTVSRWDLRRLDTPIASTYSGESRHRHGLAVTFAVSEPDDIVAVATSTTTTSDVALWSLRDASRRMLPTCTVALPSPVLAMQWRAPTDDGHRWQDAHGDMPRLHVGTTNAMHGITYCTER
ncbi:hypothetical protein H257_05156 [Aphanomyces astaci]|uniref:Uncharacterized protein n=1 Tax=Aphanomyces astaci TaxID=112090 RepID=W4GUI8_APHAT|nr:hypothetical protein H257_05156 [Aphanomyces astaci]ETV82553.1 hypothetical protein H257_05156 [Aphanomyces astaci]|eukprot:XP_009828222.1 hypothetical protein H257_05156 [Aphanomyces astaci]